MPPRDYKRPMAREPQKKPWPAWAMLSAGTLLGLFIAFLVYLAGQPASTELPQLSLPKPQAPPAPPRQTTPAKTQPTPAKPKFEFYTILPELEVVVPEPEPKPAQPDRAETEPGSTPDPIPRIDSGDVYFLQAGSFRSTAEADRMKANLILLGLDVLIQTVSVDGTKWHRVRVGPYADASRLNEARGRLRDNRIEFMTLKANRPG